MQGLAQSWLVYRLTHDTLLMGTIGFASHIPVLLLGPLAGLAADRYSRRRLVIVAQVGFMTQGLVMAALTFGGWINIPLILILSILWGVFNAFDIPARQALYIHLVGKEDLLNAIALNSMTFNAARIVGPSIAGFLVSAFGEGVCFLVNGLSFIGVITSLLIMRTPEPGRDFSTGAAAHLREGFQYAWRNRPVRAKLMVVALSNLAAASIIVLGPVFADAMFHMGSHGLGLLTGALGLGAVIGTLRLARHSEPSRMEGVVLVSAVHCGVALVLYAVSPSFYLCLLAAGLYGFGIFRLLASANTLIQTSITDAYRGRVMSLYSMTVIGMLPFGNLGAGAAAGLLGARPTVLLGALLSFAAAWLWRSHLDRKAVSNA